MRTKAPTAWSIHPFLRITPPFIAGLLLGTFRMADFMMVWTCTTASLLLWIIFLLLSPFRRWQWKPLTGISIYLLLTACGMACSLLQQWSPHATDPPPQQREQAWVVQLSEVNGPAHGRYRARATSLPDLPYLPGTVHGEQLLYIDSSAVNGPPLPGDLFAIRASCRPIRNRGNPGEPDFASMQAAKGIFVQSFVRKGELLRLGHRAVLSQDALFLPSRLWIEAILHRQLPDPEAADLASTLITGHRATMDPELLRAYADTGVVHVIAISGLHLGLIHALLLWICLPWFRRIGLAKGAGLFILPWLWTYALFTGASASVIRSAAMFTGMGLAMAMGRKQFFLNGLGSSATLLLAWRPDWIFDIGFQLSYAALLSIAMFQPGLRRCLRFTAPAAKMIWDLVTVTLAAQVLTAPLVAWHFHRLPILFLFSNLPVVPLSSMVLLLGIGVCVFAWLPALSHALGMLATHLIHLMNGQVRGIDAVPFGSIADLRPDLPQVLILYGIILVLRYGMGTGWLYRGYACWLLFTGYRLLGIRNDFILDRQKAFVVFQAGRQSLYAIVTGRDMLVLSGYGSRQDSLSRDRCIWQALEYYRCRPPSVSGLAPGRTMVWTAGSDSLTIRCGDGVTRVEGHPGHWVAELRNGEYREDAEPDPVEREKGLLVADGSCSLWKIQRWKSSPEGVPSRFHSVPEQGAFVSDMNTSPRPAP